MIQSRRVPVPRGPGARGLCAVALAGGIVLGLGQAARAQFVFDDAVLPPRVIAWRLADRGFSGITRPRYDGRVFVVEAVDPAGIPVRLFVDPAGGAIVGRQRLGLPGAYGRQDYARLERPGPGFGWTEDESGPRRIVRPLPPEQAPAAPPRPARGPGAEAARPDADPYGTNPDADARPRPPRKVARAAQPSPPKPALRATPEAPVPSLAPAEAAEPAAKSGTPAASVEGAAPAATSNGPVAGGGARAEAAKPTAQDWKDPPPEGRRPVRVIDGATIVPGATP